MQDAFWKYGFNCEKGILIGMIAEYKDGISWMDN